MSARSVLTNFQKNTQLAVSPGNALESLVFTLAVKSVDQLHFFTAVLEMEEYCTVVSIHTEKNQSYIALDKGPTCHFWLTFDTPENLTTT